MKRAAKVDLNQNEIIEHLIAGAALSTESLAAVGKDVPDLLVGGLMPCPHCGELFRQNKLLEIKSIRDGRLSSLTDGQKRWHKDWMGQVETVWTKTQALYICTERKR